MIRHRVLSLLAFASLTFPIFEGTPSLRKASAQYPGKATQEKTTIPPRPANILVDGPPPPGRRTPDSSILTIAAIQKELKLTDEQQKRVLQLEPLRKKLIQEAIDAGAERRRTMPKPGEIPFDELLALRKESTRLQNEGIDEALAQVGIEYRKILTPQQWTRLGQIKLQLDGPYAFEREDIIQKLNLDHVQVSLIAEILEGSREEFTRAGQVSVPAAEDLGTNDEYQKNLANSIKASQGIRESMMRRISRILRKKQLETYSGLLGEPFDRIKLRDGSRFAARPKADKAKEELKGGEADKDGAKIDDSKASERKTLKERRGSASSGN